MTFLQEECPKQRRQHLGMPGTSLGEIFWHVKLRKRFFETITLTVLEIVIYVCKILIKSLILVIVQLMVDGQTGQLEIAHSLVLKKKLESVTILHHLVEERTAVAQLLKL